MVKVCKRKRIEVEYISPSGFSGNPKYVKRYIKPSEYKSLSKEVRQLPGGKIHKTGRTKMVRRLCKS